MEFRNITLSIIALSCLNNLCFAANFNTPLIHSHNDYRQKVPFYQSYSQDIDIIEIDVYLNKKNQVVVAHDIEELPTAPGIIDLYINPIVKLFRQNGGKARKDGYKPLTYLIDIKDDGDKTLKSLISILKKYPDVFNPDVNPNAVRVVISGNKPNQSDFNKYPDYIQFDGTTGTVYTDDQLERIAMISDSFKRYSSWNGKGIPVKEDKIKLDSLINAVHAIDKPIRFWAAPDGLTAWNTLFTIGADIIGTDKPEACCRFFSDYSKNSFVLRSKEVENKVQSYSRLDKTTSSFEGFKPSDAYLDSPVDIYTPTYLSDNSDNKIRNVILMIGDGMGLNHILAANTVNGGLTMLGLRSVGLMHTQAKDAFTTDSAGAGSTMATGESCNNRAISVDENNNNLISLTEKMLDYNKINGIVTLGNIADATPAAFYAHTNERDNSKEIISQIENAHISLLCGSGAEHFDNTDNNNLNQKYRFIYQIDSIAKGPKNIICIDEKMGKAANAFTINLLADATKNSIDYLDSKSEDGFFLMVEGAKIDYAGHANSLPATVMEMLSFDMAVAEAIKFADTDGHTLVIVTGDHETGGLIITDGSLSDGQVFAQFVTDDHTPSILPVLSYGPSSSTFNGVFKNSDIFNKIINLLK